MICCSAEIPPLIQKISKDIKMVSLINIVLLLYFNNKVQAK